MAADKYAKVIDNDGKNDDDSLKKQMFKGFGLGYRHLQCLILTLCLCNLYSIKSSMGVALVAMTAMPDAKVYNGTVGLLVEDMNSTHTEVIFEPQLIGGETFEPVGVLNTLLLVPPYPTFDWTKQEQDTIQSAYFWGYILLQIPAGVLVLKWGARNVLSCCVFINSIVMFVFPWAALYGGWMCLVFLRCLQGLAQAFVLPGIHTFFGKWAPLEERARLMSYVYGGPLIGVALCMLIVGFISSSNMGWPGVFRMYAVLSLLLAASLWFFLANSPAEHPKISAAERDYIEHDLGTNDSKKKLPIPWRKILSCKAVWGIVAAHTGMAWIQVFLYTEMPDFMDKCMGINIKENGIATSLPFFASWITNFLFSWIMDRIVNKKILSVTNTRKLATIIGGLPVAIALASLCFVPKNIYVVETILVIIGAMKVALQFGFLVNHIDLAPNYAGTLISLSNLCANIVSSFTPIIAALLLHDVTDMSDWNNAFLISAAIAFVTNLIYVIVGTAEKAEWNEPPPEIDEENQAETAPMFKE